MAEKNRQENRTLAKFPKIKKHGKANYEFGKDFEKWLDDRFGGRKKLIAARFKTIYKINGKIENDKAFMNSNGYTYSKNYIKTLKQPISDEDKNTISQNIKHLAKWSEEHNIKLYLLVIPTKENLVLADSLYSPPRPNITEKCISELPGLPIDILYPKDLYEGKKYSDHPFYHTDQHWSEFGAFLAYQVMSEKIKKDFPKFHVCSENEFIPFYKEKVWNGRFKGFNRSYMSIHRGSGCNKLNLSKKSCKPIHAYKYYDHNMREKLDVEDGPLPMSKITHFNEGKNNLKMTLLGTSGNNFLMAFFPFSVHDVQMLRVNNQEKNEKFSMGRFEKYILDFKPDILLLTVRDHAFHTLRNLY